MVAKVLQKVKLQNNSEKICLLILYFQEFNVTLQLNQNDTQKKSFEFNIHRKYNYYETVRY